MAAHLQHLTSGEGAAGDAGDLAVARAMIAGLAPHIGRYIVPMPRDIRGATLPELVAIGFAPFDLSSASPTSSGVYMLPLDWSVAYTPAATGKAGMRAATIRLTFDGIGRLRAILREPSDGAGAATLVVQRRYTVADRIRHGGMREIGIADGGQWMHRMPGPDAEQSARSLIKRQYPEQETSALAYWDDIRPLERMGAAC